MWYVIGFFIAWPFASLATVFLLGTSMGEELFERLIPSYVAQRRALGPQVPRFRMEPEVPQKDRKKVVGWVLIIAGPFGLAFTLLGFACVVRIYYGLKLVDWVADKLQL